MLTTVQTSKITVALHVLQRNETLNFMNEEENIDIEWARLMAVKPPALENVAVKAETKAENVDVSANSETSPTLDLDF